MPSAERTVVAQHRRNREDYRCLHQAVQTNGLETHIAKFPKMESEGEEAGFSAQATILKV